MRVIEICKLISFVCICTYVDVARLSGKLALELPQMVCLGRKVDPILENVLLLF